MRPFEFARLCLFSRESAERRVLVHTRKLRRLARQGPPQGRNASCGSKLPEIAFMREVALESEVVTTSRFWMASLVLRAFADLVLYDILVVLGGFPRIRSLVKKTRAKNKPTNNETIKRICNAVDIASCFYLKQVRCMHRSFVAVRLLRKAGVKADLVIASRPVPFVSHAWVEVNEHVVNDKQGYKRRLTEMERI